MGVPLLTKDYITNIIFFLCSVIVAATNVHRAATAASNYFFVAYISTKAYLIKHIL